MKTYQLEFERKIREIGIIEVTIEDHESPEIKAQEVLLDNPDDIRWVEEIDYNSYLKCYSTIQKDNNSESPKEIH